MCDIPIQDPARRRFLSGLLLGLTATMLPEASLAVATPRQIKGPFYPTAGTRQQLGGPQAGNDLMQAPGATDNAQGDLLFISGKVLSKGGRPLPNTLVEIWQACATGRYLHPGDRAQERAQDPNFQYWGVCLTDAEGRYAFKTIIPLHYPSGFPGWTRPPHIHLRIRRTGHRDYISQFYFDDPTDPANAERFLYFNQRDAELKRIRRSERAKLIVQLDTQAAPHLKSLELAGLKGMTPPVQSLSTAPRFGRFDIRLRA